jgi:hypothetical protein
MQKRFGATIVLAITLVLPLLMVLSCSDDDDNPAGPSYETIDLAGTWLGAITGTVDGEPMEQIGGLRLNDQGSFIEFIGPDSVISASGSLTVSPSGTVSGSISAVYINSLDLEETMTLNCSGVFASQTLLNVTGTGDWSNAADSGTMSLTFSLDKENFEYISARLGYWPNGTDKWWLMFRIMVKDATRVYATSANISGEYDLFDCDDFGYCDIWWSSNNAECIQGSNNYNVGGEPDLPFDLTIHIVKSSGETTRVATIDSYTTYQ